MTEDRKQSWADIILDHSQFPRHHQKVDGATHRGMGENPFCGDRVQLQLNISTEGIIERIGIQATGCAISTASASLLASHLPGLGSDAAEELIGKVHSLLTAASSDAVARVSMGDELEALQLVRQYPGRVKCATLCWHVLRNALSGSAEVASTE